jgi:hypothetical protein
MLHSKGQWELWIGGHGTRRSSIIRTTLTALNAGLACRRQLCRRQLRLLQSLLRRCGRLLCWHYGCWNTLPLLLVLRLLLAQLSRRLLLRGQPLRRRVLWWRRLLILQWRLLLLLLQSHWLQLSCHLLRLIPQ